tara:strand:+ start:37 stop:438 length:402 start_codon:yes stop_codon:yes gene_type:complete
MDNLQTALDNVNKALATLNEVKLILEQQPIVTEHGDDYDIEHSDAYYDYQRNDPDAENPFTEPKDIARAETVVNLTPKTNTYSVQELVTTGWVLLDKDLTNLTKEEASNKIQNLIDNESYNPADLRVIVDGQR